MAPLNRPFRRPARPIRIQATGPVDQLAAFLSGLSTYLNLRGRPGIRVRIDLTVTDREQGGNP
ncbi:hypothetical protein O7623_20675 [Solwaraspora sp. WMMD791]|uniref:hypothetical protein n=1 Tax=Solwaraspora sp. WMMD791 TaxID=3016086 RepID=UPI00249B67F2|nr:hypothetical protein [Solwaraspora sp. WMMD791]WFE25768.1 hypothetical protein O7623_20675 [Solwaraspora sp. WMMD791]